MIPGIWSHDLIYPWQHELHSLLNWPGGTIKSIGDFIRVFPLLLSLSWSISALVRLGVVKYKTLFSCKITPELPSFSVLIPFCGDGEEALRSVRSLRHLTPAPQEIVMIDDGSPAELELPTGSALPANLRLIRLPQNVGKAAALNHALRLLTSDVVVCLDADTTAQSTDWSPMLAQFAIHKELGAITGKIRPKQIRNLVQVMQAIDYLAVICMVKCAESLWGGLTTVSGAWVAYRRQALVECGGWNAETSAEDIDLSWRLQSGGWRLDYDFNWTANVEMALRWSSLWRQRRRWSSGMARTLRQHFHGVFHAGARHAAVSFLAVLGCLWIVSSLGPGSFHLGKGSIRAFWIGLAVGIQDPDFAGRCGVCAAIAGGNRDRSQFVAALPDDDFTRTGLSYLFLGHSFHQQHCGIHPRLLLSGWWQVGTYERAGFRARRTRRNGHYTPR